MQICRHDGGGGAFRPSRQQQQRSPVILLRVAFWDPLSLRRLNIMAPPKYESLGGNDPDQTADDLEAVRAFPRCPHSRLDWPEGGATFLSRLTFWWFNPMIKLGNRTHVQVDDLWAVSDQESSEVNIARFRPLWQAECAAAAAGGRPASILRPVVRFVLPSILQVAVLKTCSTLFQFLRPVLLQQILLLVEDDPAALVPAAHGWTLAVGLFLATVLDFMCTQHVAWMQYKQCTKARAAVIGLLYEQTVLLSDGTKQLYSSGKITNMMDTDQSTIQVYTTQINNLWQVRTCCNASSQRNALRSPPPSNCPKPV